MAIALAQGSNNTGTVTPATPGSLTTTAGNLLLLVIAVAGTSPTITTPTSWTQIQKNQGATLSVALYAFPGNPGGATNPSVTLGGTVTGWGAAMFEFSGEGASVSYEALVSSAITNQAVTGLSNIFPSQQLPQTNMLFFYTVARLTAAITANNSGLGWSATQQAMSANGVAIDSYWGTNPGPGWFPSGAGTLGSAVASSQVAAWFNSNSAQSVANNSVGGLPGVYVPTFYQGMIGG